MASVILVAVVLLITPPAMVRVFVALVRPRLYALVMLMAPAPMLTPPEMLLLPPRIRVPEPTFDKLTLFVEVILPFTVVTLLMVIMVELFVVARFHVPVPKSTLPPLIADPKFQFQL